MNMRLNILCVSAVALILAAPWMPAQPAADPTAARPGATLVSPGRIVVKFDAARFAAGVDLEDLGRAGRAIGARRISPWLDPALVRFRAPAPTNRLFGAGTSATSLLQIYVVEIDANQDPVRAAELIGRVPGVEYAEPMFRRRLLGGTNDPMAFELWYLDIIGARAAWDSVRCDSTSVIAIVDAGINRQHEDLSSTIWTNPGELGDDGSGGRRETNQRDDDGNGLVDDWRGYDFAGTDGAGRDNEPDPGGGSQHGTAMAGIAAASGDNGIGAVGVAFGARLMSVKITDEQSANPELFNMYEAVLYAAKMGARVINCSWGESGFMRSEQEVIDVVTGTYDAVVVAAAGNSGVELDFYPASYRGVLSIAAVRNGDTRASFSNYGYRIDLSSPGAFIYGPSGNGYGYDSGTSHAAAVASGGTALVRARYPQLTAAETIELLRASSEDISATLGDVASRMGSGRINLYNAVAEGPSLASARAADLRLVPTTGDAVLDPGETAAAHFEVVNALGAASDVRVSVASATPGVTVNDDTISLGSMTSGERRAVPDNAFSVTLAPDVAPDTRALLVISVSTQHRTNLLYREVHVAPTFLTTDLNNIALTVNSSGNLAHNGSNYREGLGLRYRGGRDLLFHAGLVVGTSPERLASSLRVGSSSLGTDSGFRVRQPYRLTTTPDSSLQTGTTIFSDSHLESSARPGLDVRLTTYERRDPANRNLVLLVYRLTNTAGTDLANAFAGLYLDWDLTSDGQEDIGAFDDASSFGWVRNNAAPDLVVAAAVASDQPVNYDMFDNFDVGLPSSFPAIEKFNRIAGGIRTRALQPSELGMMIGAGPFTVPAGSSVEVAFILTAGSAVDSLRSAVVSGRALYRATLGVDAERPVRAGLHVGLAPNPVAALARLHVQLPAAGRTIVRIVDGRGVVVSTPFSGHLTAGLHEIPLNLESLPDGVYAFEVITTDALARGSFVRLTE